MNKDIKFDAFYYIPFLNRLPSGQPNYLEQLS